MKQKSKALEFIYQDTEIHFLLNNDDNVMVNATEMAKAFGKRVDHFLKADHVKAFISILEFTPNGGNSEPIPMEKIIKTKGQSGTYFHRALSLKFAAWLDPSFELWIYQTIEKVLFGHYKEHWDAHMMQEQAKKEMEVLKSKLIKNPTQEDVIAYFEQERLYNQAKSIKQKAISNQYKLLLK